MNIVYNTSGARWARGRTPHCASKRVWVKSTYRHFDTWLFHWSDAASAFQKNVVLPFGTHAKGNEEKPNRQLCILHYIVPFLFMPHIQYPISAPLATFPRHIPNCSTRDWLTRPSVKLLMLTPPKIFPILTKKQQAVDSRKDAPRVGRPIQSPMSWSLLAFTSPRRLDVLDVPWKYIV